MNSQEAAREIGTDARTLRRFLRSPRSTFEAVGSGGRYQFTDKDIPTLRRKFAEWMKTEQPVKPTREAHHNKKAAKPTAQHRKDREVWDAEGEVIVPDVRDPRVRRQVRAIENERCAALERMLREAGLHISQHQDV